MRTLYSFILALTFTCCNFLPILDAGENSRQEYFDLIKNNPSIVHYLGDASKGEIEIILDEQKVAEVEKTSGIDVGVIARSKWGWLLIHEVCKFPDGHSQVFGRFILSTTLESYAGVAVMPIMPDGKIVLICNFRHPTRSWEIELPRGMVDMGEDLVEAAKRETKEETGMVVNSMKLLGVMPPDNGLTSTLVSIYMAEVIDQQLPHHEEGEVIEEILALSISEVKQAFMQGYYECSIKGEKKRVPFRDPFLAYALLLYEITSQSS